MKTDTLIDLLARDAGPAPRHVMARRLWPVVAAGVVASAWAAIAVFGLVPLDLFATGVPWMKMAYAGALALAAGWWTARLSRPAAPVARPQHAVLAVVGLMAVAGAASLAALPAEARLPALMGHSWSTCPFSVLLLSLPGLGAALWAVRGLAPTRPRLAGLAAGLFAGALGALGYSLACPEASPAFVAVWYSLGIALTGAAGAALGPRLLRW